MLLKLLSLLFTTVLFCGASNVPVLLWSNLRIEENILPSSLRSMPYSHFEQFFFDSFHSKNLLLFLVDELSIEDFSGNENSFKNVHKQVERHNSIYLPNVENPSFLVNDLPDYGFKVSKLTENELGGLAVRKDSSNAIIIKLPATTQSSNRKYPLQKTDEIIRKVLSKFEKVKDYTVMLTGIRPVQNIAAAMKGEAKHSIQKRNANRVGKVFITECALMHVSQDLFFTKNSVKYTLPADKLMDGAISECKKNMSTIQLTYGGLDQLGQTTVKFIFGIKYARKWIIHSAELKSDLSPAPLTFIAPSWLPVMMVNESMACAAPFTFVMVPIDASGRTKASLRVEGVQIQAFTGGAKKFSRAVDCIGFFSMPIWAGLVVAFLLVAILLWGFDMITNLKTMDHFDDPKAKPLVQTTSE